MLGNYLFILLLCCIVMKVVKITFYYTEFSQFQDQFYVLTFIISIKATMFQMLTVYTEPKVSKGFY